MSGKLFNFLCSQLERKNSRRTIDLSVNLIFRRIHVYQNGHVPIYRFPSVFFIFFSQKEFFMLTNGTTYQFFMLTNGTTYQTAASLRLRRKSFYFVRVLQHNKRRFFHSKEYCTRRKKRRNIHTGNYLPGNCNPVFYRRKLFP